MKDVLSYELYSTTLALQHKEVYVPPNFIEDPEHTQVPFKVL